MFPAVKALMSSILLPPEAWLPVMEDSTEVMLLWDLGPGESELGAA